MQHKTPIDFRDREPVQQENYEEAIVYTALGIHKAQKAYNSQKN